MYDLHLDEQSESFTSYNGFFDGQNKTIPDNTELSIVVTDGFIGIEEGKSLTSCFVNVEVTSAGEFQGQKYKYQLKVFDMDANKRDLAKRNLSVIDAQAGFPLTQGRMPLTTENMQYFWAGKSHCRAKFGLFLSEEDGKQINFIRGLGFDREKMLKPQQQQQTQQQQQNNEDFEDLDF